MKYDGREKKKVILLFIFIFYKINFMQKKSDQLYDNEYHLKVYVILQGC